MDKNAINNIIANICANDNRYAPNAYHNIFKALAYCETVLGCKKDLTAKELASAYKDVTLAKYGPLALDVTHHWGIYSTRDIGNIVFNLVNAKLLGTSKGDKLEDFNNIFDLNEEMQVPYIG